MANTRITALGELSAAPAVTDVLCIVDVDDTTMSASGTTKKIQITKITPTLGDQTLTLGGPAVTSITGMASLTVTEGLGTVIATSFTGALVGNSSTATALETARTIAGVSFDGSGNIAIPITGLSDVYGSMSPTDGQVLTYDTTNGWQAEAAGAGTIEGVTAGTNLNGGGSSGTVTLNLDTTIAGLTSVTSTAFVGDVTGDLTGDVTGDLTGDVTGNCSGTAATVTGATQASITSAANLVTVGTIGTGVWQGTAVDGAYVDIEGTEVKSAGETGGTKFLREDGDGTCSWQAVSGSGTVTSVGGTGTVNGLALTGTVTTSGNLTLGGTLSVDLTSDVTGTLPAGNGGTGLTAITTLLNSNTTKTDVGLSAVENTALSTWAGTSNVTTLGTIATGTWNGTAIDGAYVDVEGTEIKSTGESGGTKYLREDGDGTCSWQAVSGGSGTVTSVGGTGTVNGLTLTGTVTGSGNLTLGGTLPVEIGIACSDETTALTTGTGKATFRLPHAMTLTSVRASVTTAPAGSVLTVDINESGSTVLSTKVTIDAGEKTSTTAATPPVISDSSLADDAEITVDIDTIGSGTAGAGLKIWLIGTR